MQHDCANAYWPGPAATPNFIYSHNHIIILTDTPKRNMLGIFLIAMGATTYAR
jgi:hypothetical protein